MHVRSMHGAQFKDVPALRLCMVLPVSMLVDQGLTIVKHYPLRYSVAVAWNLSAAFKNDISSHFLQSILFPTFLGILFH